MRQSRAKNLLRSRSARRGVKPCLAGYPNMGPFSPPLRASLASIPTADQDLTALCQLKAGARHARNKDAYATRTIPWLARGQRCIHKPGYSEHGALHNLRFAARPATPKSVRVVSSKHDSGNRSIGGHGDDPATPSPLCRAVTTSVAGVAQRFAGPRSRSLFMSDGGGERASSTTARRRGTAKL
jgi:hypothetical protein